jgi:hypothetical protein
MRVLGLFGLLLATVVEVPAFQVGSSSATTKLHSSDVNTWNGEVVPDEGGVIRGCTVTPVGSEPHTEWVIQIDGVEADLGRFSEAIYKKITGDAKQQRFQGFRPGTIPPHLEPTYRAFAMDECARETVLEAMEQNNIRPFTDARSKLEIQEVAIPPPIKKTRKKKSKKRKTQQPQEEKSDTEEPSDAPVQWQMYENMKAAIDAGWKPGQSFSFRATNVQGQKVLGQDQTTGAKPIGGLNF